MWSSFISGLGLGPRGERLQKLSPQEIERTKADAERIAARAVAGYLAHKEAMGRRAEARAIADAHKRKGPIPEAVREHLRAGSEDFGQPLAG